MDAISECDTHLISANRSIHDYKELNALVVKDKRADFVGPLSGIESAMNASSAEWFYVVSVDVVGLSEDWLDHLIEKQHQTKALWVGTHIHDRLQPLVGLWSRQLLPMISEYLDQGERRVMEFVAPWQDSFATIPSDQLVINVNTPEVLDQLSSS
jgi:molybdopterin-guanine dinucleotide biosynthesis protein A